MPKRYSIAQFKDYETAQQETEKDATEFNKMEAQFLEVFKELQLSFNYSLRHFYYQLFQAQNHEAIQNSVKSVLGAFLRAYPEVGYSPDQVALTTFLLCFSTEPAAYSLLTLIYAEIIPCQLYPVALQTAKYDYSSEVEKTLSVLVQAFKLAQKDIPIVRKFLLERISLYIDTLTLNFLLFETTFFIFDQMLSQPKSSYDDLSKYLAAAFFPHTFDMKNLLNEYDEIELLILRSIKASIVQDGYFKTKSVNLNQIVKPFARASAIVTRQKTVIIDSPQSQFEQQLNDLQELNYRLLKENNAYKKEVQDLKIQISAYITQVESLTQVLSQVQQQELMDQQKISIYKDPEYVKLKEIIQADPANGELVNSSLEAEKAREPYLILIKKLEHALVLDQEQLLEKESTNNQLRSESLKLQEAVSNLESVKQELQATIEQLKERIKIYESSTVTLQGQLDLRAGEIISLQSKLEKAAKQCERVEAELNGARQELKIRVGQLKEAESAISLSENIKLSLDAENLALFKQNEQLRSKNSELVQAEKQVREELRQLSEQGQREKAVLMSKHEFQIAQLVSEAAGLNEELESLRVANERQAAELSELSQEKKASKIQVDSQILQIQKLYDQIDEMTKITEQQEQQLSEINDQLIKLQHKLNSQIKELQQHEELRSQVGSMQQEISQQAEQNGRLQQELNSAQAKLIKSQEELFQLQNSVQSQKSISVSTSESKQMELDESSKQQQKIQKQKLKLIGEREENILLKQQLSKALEEVEQFKQALATLKVSDLEQLRLMKQMSDQVLSYLENDEEAEVIVKYLASSKCKALTIPTKMLFQILKTVDICRQQYGSLIRQFNKELQSSEMDLNQQFKLISDFVASSLTSEASESRKARALEKGDDQQMVIQIRRILLRVSESSKCKASLAFVDRVSSPTKKTQTMEDVVLILEVKNQQILTLKQLLKESHEEIHEMRALFQQIKQLIGL